MPNLSGRGALDCLASLTLPEASWFGNEDVRTGELCVPLLSRLRGLSKRFSGDEPVNSCLSDNLGSNCPELSKCKLLSTLLAGLVLSVCVVPRRVKSGSICFSNFWLRSNSCADDCARRRSAGFSWAGGR